MLNLLKEDENATKCYKYSCTGEKEIRWITCSASDWIMGNTQVLQLRLQHNRSPLKYRITLLEAEPRQHCDQKSWLPSYPHTSFWCMPKCSHLSFTCISRSYPITEHGLHRFRHRNVLCFFQWLSWVWDSSRS